MGRSFNGTTDQIGCGSGTANQPGSAMSASFWVNPSQLGGGSDTYALMVSNLNVTNQQAFGVYLKTDGKLAIYTKVNNYDGSGSHTLSTSTWYNIVATYDTTNGLVGYVGGASDGTAAAAGSLATTTTTLQFGFDNSTAGRTFGGKLADVALWNVALTVGEVAALAKGVRANQVRPNALTFFAPLDGLASPEPDLSGNANNGTLTGTSATTGAPLAILTPKRSIFTAVAATATIYELINW